MLIFDVRAPSSPPGQFDGPRGVVWCVVGVRKVWYGLMVWQSMDVAQLSSSDAIHTSSPLHAVRDVIFETFCARLMDAAQRDAQATLGAGPR